MLQPLTVFLDDTGRPSYTLREFHTSAQKFDLALMHSKQAIDIGDGFLRVKFFTRENVQTEVILLRKSVNADVTFGNKYKAGNAPILWFLGIIPEHIRGHDFGHLDLGRIFTQEVVNEGYVFQSLPIASISIQHQVCTKTIFRLFQFCHLLDSTSKSCPFFPKSWARSQILSRVCNFVCLKNGRRDKPQKLRCGLA